MPSIGALSSQPRPRPSARWSRGCGCPPVLDETTWPNRSTSTRRSGTSMSVRLGRPRSSEADQAILDAALEVFAGAGYDGLTIEAVADRAGVAKSTIYRRYQDKAELLLAAVECSAEISTPAPDTGSL